MLQGISDASAPTARHALLVGVNRYVDPNLQPPLRFCVNDVVALGRTLEEIGYQTVITLHDEATQEHLLPSAANIEAELTRLADELGPNDLLLVHFSCHGRLIDGKPYLLPADARLKILGKTAIAVDDVKTILGKSKARRRVLLLDACHAGASLGRDGPDPELTPDFIRNVFESAEGLKVLAGSTAQQIAHESAEAERGVFTSFVIEALRGAADRDGKGFVTFDDLKRHVCDGVVQWSRERSLELQRPTDEGAGTGDMILADFRR
jgi:uncharacterized caspase-like protein